MQYFNEIGYNRIWIGFMLLLTACMLFWGQSSAQAADFAQRAGNMSEITGIRVGTDSDKTRIVVDGTKETEYKISVISNPQRIIIDIQNAWVSPNVKKATVIDSRFAKAVRIAQHDSSTVRVVVESSMGKNNYKVFALKGGAVPYRLVMDFGKISGSSKNSGIDFNAGAKPQTDSASASTGTADSSNASNSSNTAAGDNAGSSTTDSSEPDLSPGIKGKVIALDAGHGGSDTGAIGPTGVTEKGVTLRVAKALQKLLQAEGATVLMTRTIDTEVSPKKANASDVEELQARCDVGNNGNADIFISMHMDSFTNSTPSGTTGYYYTRGSAASQRLAQYVSEGVVASLGTGNRGNKSCNFYVVKHTDMPATLVEMAFISNDKEESLMNSEEGINKAAEGILNGLRRFFS